MSELEARFGAIVNKSNPTKRYPMLVLDYPANTPSKIGQKRNEFLKQMYKRELKKYNAEVD
ncbi:MAG: hypothetical protein WC812_01525 [Candidatus Pacearchaeota archaeon]|jgi:hypothetical protein